MGSKEYGRGKQEWGVRSTGERNRSGEEGVRERETGVGSKEYGRGKQEWGSLIQT